MSHFKTLRLPVVLLALAACAPSEQLAPEEDLQHTTGQALYASTWASLNVRGTFNNWGVTPMALEADHQWAAEVTFGTAANQRFKFDVRGDWSMNFGDDEADNQADRNGRDIAAGSGKTYRLHFNDESHFYFLEEKTFMANVSVRLPAGLAASSAAGAQARLYRDGQNYGWNLVYVDGNNVYVPLSSLVKGSSYRLTLEFFSGLRRFGGEVSWTVDGRADELQLAMNVSELSMDGFGVVDVTVYADRFENDRLVSGAWGEVGVFYGDWHAGDRRGNTDAQGKLSLPLPAGPTQLGVMIMTGSHSIADTSSQVTVVSRARVTHEIHLAPTTVAIRAHADVGFGNAIYLTGATGYLGDWKTARRLTWDSAQRQWSHLQNLPLGVPFKLLVGPWSLGESAPVSQLKWEVGGNHTVTPPNGSYQSDLQVWPRF